MRPRNHLRGPLHVLLSVLVAACGGGGGGSGTAAPAAPTVTLAATSVAVGSSTTITWSSVDATSCTASGDWSGTLATSGTKTITPTAVGSSTYTLTCANSAGSSKASTVTLTATMAAAFSYGSPNYHYTVGLTAETLTPSNASSIKTWAINPAPPAGLTFSSTTGAISGTPTANSPTTTYVITGASSSGQQSTLNLAIDVTSNILLNLGDVGSLQFIQFDTAHVLTQDSSGQWILWDYATAAQIASGISLIIPPNRQDIPETLTVVALAGPTVVIHTLSGLEVRSSATGQVLAEIPVHLQWWSLATDGSYVCAGNGTSLSCWSPSGQPLFTKSGNYLTANVLALPSALLIALGAAGNGVIETVSTAGWTSSVGPAFQGTFSSWFVDGSRFLTTIAAGTQIGTTIAAFNTLYVYSLASVLEDTETMPTLQGLTGQGNWFWTTAAQAPLNIYAIGSNTASCIPIPCTMPTPTATYTLSPLVPIGTFIASIAGNALTVIDLSGSTPVETSYTQPLANPTAFAAVAPSQFMVGNGDGVIVDGSAPSSPRYFGYGRLKSFAGSTTRVVLTTASGDTLSYNLTTNAFETTVQLPATVRQVALSADGSVLAAVSGLSNVDVYSMPSGTLINSFASPITVETIALSSTGTVLIELVCGPEPCSGQTIPVAGGAPSVYPGVLAPPQLSPDGTQVAVSDTLSPSGTILAAQLPPTTKIYHDGALVTTVPGWVLGWPTNSSFIVSTFTFTGQLLTGGQLNNFIFNGDEIYSATGVLLGSSPIGANYSLQSLSSDLVFVNTNSMILSATTGATVWASADPPLLLTVAGPVGALPASFFTGSAVVFSSGNLVVTQPY